MDLHGPTYTIVGMEEVHRLIPALGDLQDARLPPLAGVVHPQAAMARHDAIAWSYARAADARGVEIHQQTELTGFLRDGAGRVTGVRTKDGDEVLASAVISNADAAHTYSSLIGEEHLPFLTKRKVAKTHLSVASICIFLGTDLDLSSRGMTDANIWVYPTTDLDRFYEPILRGEMTDLDFFFLSSPSLKDPGSADGPPAGHDALEMVTLAPFEPFAAWQGKKSMRRGEDYEALKQSILDRYMGPMERFVPDLRNHIKVAEVATPVTNITYATAPRGSIYGPEATPDQMGPFRYPTKGALDGLYLCGSSTLGGGVVPAAASGMQAGRRAAKWVEAQRPAQAAVPARAGA